MADAGACVVVVMAAGGSSRMGEPKQLLAVDGEPLVRRAARVALDAGLARVLVVLGAEAERVRAAIQDLDLAIVVNAGWREGLASSLRAGVGEVERIAPGARGLIVLPADQPRMPAGHLRRIDAAQRRSGATVVASDYGDHRGPPAYFGRPHFAAIKALRGDGGAREFLQGDGVETVAAPAGSDFDLDRPDDLLRLRER